MKAKAKKSAKKSFSSFVSSLTRRAKSSSPTRAAAKGEEEDLSSSPIQFNKKIFKNQAP